LDHPELNGKNNSPIHLAKNKKTTANQLPDQRWFFFIPIA
jgi:hypothetical protein